MKTNVRLTSLLAFEELKAAGKLHTRRAVILRRMMEDGKGDYSRAELARLTGIVLQSVCGRVNELVESGALREMSPRKCGVTGKTVTPVALTVTGDYEQASLFPAMD